MYSTSRQYFDMFEMHCNVTSSGHLTVSPRCHHSVTNRASVEIWISSGVSGAVLDALNWHRCRFLEKEFIKQFIQKVQNPENKIRWEKVGKIDHLMSWIIQVQLILVFFFCGFMLRPFSLRFSLLRHQISRSTQQKGVGNTSASQLPQLDFAIFGCLNFAQRRWLRDAKRLCFGVGFCKAAELAGKGTREPLSDWFG